MSVRSLAIIFGVNMAFMYAGFRSLSIEHVALIAVAFSGVTLGGYKFLKLK